MMAACPPPLIDTLRGLRAGLGVEDISLRTGHPVEEVRGHVGSLRASGALADLYQPKGKPA